MLCVLLVECYSPHSIADTGISFYQCIYLELEKLYFMLYPSTSQPLLLVALTTGNISEGAIYSGHFRNRVWSGGDVKLIPDILGNYTLAQHGYDTHVIEQDLNPSDRGFYAPGATSFPTPDYSASIFAAQSQLTERIKEHSFNLAISTAEGKECVDMVVDTTMKIGKCIRKLTRWDLKGAARALGVDTRRSVLGIEKGDVSSAWLGLQYGWLPLISDTTEAAKAFAKSCNKVRRTRVRSSSGEGFSFDGSLSPSNYSYVYHNARRSTQIICILYEDLTQRAELGLDDPAAVVWEKIPYSFVVDWFLPVGDYLQNLNLIPKVKGTFIITHKTKGNAHFENTSGNIYYVGAAGIVSQCQLKRLVQTGLEVEKPQFVGLPDAMSPKRIFNAIALGHLGWGRFR